MDVATPQYIKVFVPLQAANIKMVLGKLVAHRTDVDKRIDITIHDDDVRRNVAGGELSWAVTRAGAVSGGTKSGCVGVIVVHDKAPGAHDLKPMYDRFCAGKGIEVRISCEFLRERDIMGVPREEEDERGVNEAGEDRWVENGLPHESRGEDGATTEYKEEKSRTGIKSTRVSVGRSERRGDSRGFHETINKRGR